MTKKKTRRTLQTLVKCPSNEMAGVWLNKLVYLLQDIYDEANHNGIEFHQIRAMIENELGEDWYDVTDRIGKQFN